MPKTHALLGPSKASRWMSCTPSARLEEEFPSGTSNDAADEGTLAHTISELLLKNHFKMMPKIIFEKEMKKAKADKFYNAEMLGHCQSYVSFIVEKMAEMENPSLFIEESLDLEEFIPEGRGTSDCYVVAERLLDVVDFKYGKGVLVEAERNKQMMIYGLGAYLKANLSYEIHTVRMTIFQPRLDNYSSFSMSVEELLDWAENELRPAAQKAFEGKGEYKPGDHCKFCKAKNTCKALADMNMELAKYAFENPDLLKIEDISEILEKGSNLVEWFNSVKAYALEQAKSGTKIPGFKLVNGKSNRQYVSEESVLRVLKSKKVDKDLYMSEPSLLSIGVLEKNLGKDKVQEYIGKLIVKPTGSPTLVPVWDKRPEIGSADSAKEAFKDVE